MTVASRFSRYVLRTTDLVASRAFYIDVLGADFFDGALAIEPLPAQALARGAPPHWLGHIGVDDVDACAARFVALGAEQLGVVRRTEAETVTIFRDPFGAIVALTSVKSEPDARVGFHVLNVKDEDRAFDAYGKLFGWTGVEGPHRMFAWDESGRVVGSVADTARQPNVHTHWMFFFRVSSLEEAITKARARGGLVVSVMTTSHGERFAPCDDPQGAAFGLIE